jgi:hypothetical protein
MNKNPIQAFFSPDLLAVRWLIRIGLPLLVCFGILLPGLAVASDQTGISMSGPVIQHGQTISLKLPVSVQSHTQGATATLLPTGKWLILGGQRTKSSAPVSNARLYDPNTKKITPLTSGLIKARAYHSATLLPDGRVLVLGGSGKVGSLVTNAEFFNPNTATSIVASLKFSPRSKHRATLLVDGRVLVSGGVDGHGVALADVVLIDPRTGTAEPMSVKLDAARLNHLSTLLPQHDVLIWGGVGKDGLPLEQAELYQPGEPYFHAYGAAASAKLLAEINNPNPPVLVDSEPEDGAAEVAVGQMLSVRFSKPLKVTSVNAKTVVLIGPSGAVLSSVTPTEGGLVVFVVPKQDLLPGADYTLVIQGTVDQRDQPLAFVSIGFTTESLNGGTNTLPGKSNTTTTPSGTNNKNTVSTDNATADSTINAKTSASNQLVAGASAQAQAVAEVDDGEAWIPGSKNRHGNWRSGRSTPESTADLLDNDDRMRHKIKAMRTRLPHNKQRKHRELFKLASSGDTTGVTGTVLRLNDKPLANATLTIGTKSTHSDNQGNFELTGIAPGHYEMVVDGSTANRPNHEYLQFILGVDVHSNGITELSHNLYIPRIRPEDWVDLPSPTPNAKVITHPAMPGLEIHIPKGTIFRDRQGNRVPYRRGADTPGSDTLSHPRCLPDLFHVASWWCHCTRHRLRGRPRHSDSLSQQHPRRCG